MGTANEDLADSFVRHRLALLRFEGGVVQDVVRSYIAATKPITDDLRDLSRKLKKGETLTAGDNLKIEVLRGKLSTRTRLLHDEVREIVGRSVEGATTAEAEAVAKQLKRSLTTALADEVTDAPIEDLLLATVEPIGGLRWTDRLAIDLLEVDTRLQGALGQIIAEGQSIPRAAAAIGRATGIVETYKGRLVAIARTEIQRVANHAAIATYNENTDVVKGVQYLATLDSRTCLICAPLHNTTYLYEGGKLPTTVPVPPLHPRCRCFLAPIVKSWEELGIPGTRKSRERFDGEAADAMDFDQWLKRQPVSTQREVLGPARLKAWQSGTLSLSSFSDDREILTLDQLGERYASF